jgi:predicted NBD/HSP70 family sugar kinase
MATGSNANGVRRYNERLVLSIIRRQNGASKADLAKATGLSPQAAVRIVEDLESSGLLIQAGKRTGGMGQPSTIYKINGENGFTIGVEIGRSRLTCALLNFNGSVLAMHSRNVSFPEPEMVIEEIRTFADRELRNLSAAQRQSFIGIGIAMPWFISEWRDEMGLTPKQGQSWRAPDLEDVFRTRLEAAVMFENDGNSATLAEMLCGAGAGLGSFLYFHIGTFIGGGLVLRGQLEEGRNGNAGALASIPVPKRTGRGHEFLLHRASLYRIEASGPPADVVEVSAAWLEDCAEALAFVALGTNSLLDLDAIIFGGGLTTTAIAELTGRIGQIINQTAPPDFFKPNLIPGTIGANAPAIGAGLLPLHSTYSPNLKSLLKSERSE